MNWRYTMNSTSGMGAFFVVLGSAACIFEPLLRLVGIGSIGVGFVVIVIGYKAAAHRARLLQTGTLGTATILDFTDTGVRYNNNPSMRLKVRIQVPGEAPFEATNMLTVSRFAVPREGEGYYVLFDPQNPNDFIFAPRDRTPLPTSGSHQLSSSSTSAGEGDTIGQLERLAVLRDKGALSPEEFEAQKRKLLGETRDPG